MLLNETNYEIRMWETVYKSDILKALDSDWQPRCMANRKTTYALKHVTYNKLCGHVHPED